MKVHLRALGCRLNQSEIETMARQFTQQGHELVDDAAQADWLVVNTCAVTQEATHASRQMIRQLHRASPNGQVIVTGCYARISPDEIGILPGVGQIVDNLSKDALVEKVTGVPVEPFDLEPAIRANPASASGRTRAFIKVQDGCDNACTFCVTTIARGEGRSRTIEDIVREVRYLHATGYQEMVLTGVHLGSYGHDSGDQDGLIHLVRAILADTDVPRIRLSSLEPWDLTPEFFDLWQNPRLCRHLHLPLQSGCDATLRRMARRTNQARFSALMQAARERISGVGITTDVIVGFPGETDEEFAISEAFVRQMDFAGLHVFRYSRRPGTAAAKMRGQVRDEAKKERSARLIALSEALEHRFAEAQIGDVLPVLWEQVAGATEDGFVNVGYTDSYVRVRCIHPRALTNQVISARMEGYDPAQRQIQVTPLLG